MTIRYKSETFDLTTTNVTPVIVSYALIDRSQENG